ncbi:chemotaxis protein CheT [Rhizobium sp. LjRoot258]|uniref:chemotaxis protein CheT n=1 Tax=Rhizobium sp. LjRoot258 TaxID=3342299 RepID=UPI003ED14ECB
MTVNAMTEQPSPAESLPDVLMRIVSELHDVAYLIERIEPQLLEVGGAAELLNSPESMKVMQGIDLAVQKTRGLAEFIDTITGEIPQDWAVDVATALSLVKLSEMQRALGGAMHHGNVQPLAKAAGDFDFF